MNCFLAISIKILKRTMLRSALQIFVNFRGSWGKISEYTGSTEVLDFTYQDMKLPLCDYNDNK